MFRTVVTVLLLVVAAKLNPSPPSADASGSDSRPLPESDTQTHEPWRQRTRRVVGDRILPAMLFSVFGMAFLYTGFQYQPPELPYPPFPIAYTAVYVSDPSTTARLVVRNGEVRDSGYSDIEVWLSNPKRRVDWMLEVVEDVRWRTWVDDPDQQPVVVEGGTFVDDNDNAVQSIYGSLPASTELVRVTHAKGPVGMSFANSVNLLGEQTSHNVGQLPRYGNVEDGELATPYFPRPDLNLVAPPDLELRITYDADLLESDERSGRIEYAFPAATSDGHDLLWEGVGEIEPRFETVNRSLERSEQEEFFYSGILLGLAGSAFLTAAAALLTPAFRVRS